MVLVDEAQLVFDTAKAHSQGFWHAVKTIMAGGSEVYVVMAAPHGVKRSGAVDPVDVTPVVLNDPRCLLGVDTSAVHGLSLSFSRPEFDEVYEKFAEASGLDFMPYVPDHVFCSCSGQVSKDTHAAPHWCILVVCSVWMWQRPSALHCVRCSFFLSKRACAVCGLCHCRLDRSSRRCSTCTRTFVVL